MSKSAVLGMIKCLNKFFMAPNMKEITFFIWDEAINENDSLVNLYYTWSSEINKVIFKGNSGDFIFKEKPIKEEVLFSEINSILETYTEIQKDEQYLLKYFTGIIFNKDNWEDIIIKVFGEYAVNNYRINQLYEKISDNIPYKTKKLINKNKI
jgi:hypothetical protein